MGVCQKKSPSRKNIQHSFNWDLQVHVGGAHSSNFTQEFKICITGVNSVLIGEELLGIM